MKDNLDYYPHDVNAHNHRKFRSLRRKYGWGGEGMFWALNNHIAQSKGCWLDLSDETVTDMLSDDFDMSDTEFSAFINCLVEKIKLLVRKGDKITTDTLQETYGKVADDREKKSLAGKKSAALRKKKAPKIQQVLNTCSTDVEQSKVKERKEKESKGKINAGEPATDLDQFSDENETAQEISKFVRTKMRELAQNLPDGRYLPEVADEIGRAAAGDGFKFTKGNRGHEKGLRTWATTYVAKMPSAEECEEETPAFDKKPMAYDRVIGIYQSVTGRLTSENQRPFLSPIIRENITKPGLSDEQIRAAFHQLRKAGPVFDDLDYTLRNISKLLTWAQQSAA